MKCRLDIQKQEQAFFWKQLQLFRGEQQFCQALFHWGFSEHRELYSPRFEMLKHSDSKAKVHAESL